jgi:hypothetical protein
MNNVRNGSVLLEVDVQPVWDKVLGDHLTGLDDTSLLRQLRLGEVLLATSIQYTSTRMLGDD